MSLLAQGCLGVIELEKILPCSQSQLTSILLIHYTPINTLFEAEVPTVSIILFFPTLTGWMLPGEDRWLGEERFLGTIKMSVSSKFFTSYILHLGTKRF